MTTNTVSAVVLESISMTFQNHLSVSSCLSAPVELSIILIVEGYIVLYYCKAVNLVAIKFLGISHSTHLIPGWDFLSTLNFVMWNSQLFSTYKRTITVHYKPYFQNVNLSGVQIISMI